MRASDLYGALEFANARTQDETQPVQNNDDQQKANDTAKRKDSAGGYGMMALLIVIGILIGGKFLLEK